ncbi:MAG: hypothetical protein M3151_03830, partial [Actinomycetota bacterium]|nr:hypothetical protein [Actinomycetota bacterium]
RDVTSDDRDAEVRSIAEEAGNLGTPMIPVPDTATAAEHAASLGLLAQGAVTDIRKLKSTPAPK